MKAVRSELGEITYSTKTRGERKLEAARPAGRGFYGIIRHGYASSDPRSACLLAWLHPVQEDTVD
jgi:hypothetical protein